MRASSWLYTFRRLLGMRRLDNAKVIKFEAVKNEKKVEEVGTSTPIEIQDHPGLSDKSWTLQIIPQTHPQENSWP